jgi:hypothetical protein
MTTNEVRALVLACVLVAGILLGIAVGRAQVVEEQHTWQVDQSGGLVDVTGATRYAVDRGLHHGV